MPHAKLRHLCKYGDPLLHQVAELCGPVMLKLVLPLYVEDPGWPHRPSR
jgi:hypothetical protein